MSGTQHKLSFCSQTINCAATTTKTILCKDGTFCWGKRRVQSSRWKHKM